VQDPDGQLGSKLITELRDLTGREVSTSWPVIQFPFKDPATGKWIDRSIAVPVDSLIYPLYLQIWEMRNTGFLPASITAWIFCEIRPVIPRVEVRSSISDMYLMPFPRHFTTITLNSPDITWEELWHIYRSIRSHSNVQRRQKVHPLHERIYQLVRERGGPPAQGKTAFWESIRQELRKERRKGVPGRWESIRKAYISITRRNGSNEKGASRGRKHQTKK
jgi:hypothetical protein